MNQTIKNNIIGILKSFLISILIFGQINLAYAQSAGQIPNALQQFFDNNGNPLTSGTVGMYIPNTLTPKTTWQDANATIPNTNPIVLDAAGRATIYGSGVYRQILKDSSANLVWDAPSTAAPGTVTPSLVGDGQLVGSIKPWAGIVAPAQYAFSYGQELSRTTYSVLFTAITQSLNVICANGSNTLSSISDTSQIPVGSPVELICVPSGTTVVSKTSSTVLLSNPSNISLSAIAVFFPFGNGNGATTFNIPDLRGYVIAGRQNMGGTAATRLPTTYNASAVTGGASTVTLTQAQLPINIGNVNSTVTDLGHRHSVITTLRSVQSGSGSNVSDTLGIGTDNFGYTEITTSNITVATTISNAAGGNSTSIIQPTITLNYVIKVTPDASASSVTGVASLGGMTGVIDCGFGLLCTGNVVSVGTTGNVTLTVPTSANISSDTIPSDVNSIYSLAVAGTYSPTGNRGACGLLYSKGTSSPTGVYGEILNTPSSIYWEPVYSNSPVKACEFGTFGNGSYNYTTGAVTGTDNQAQINAALSYALQNNYEAVCLNDGYYKTTDTLQVGYGNGFRPISLKSCNNGRATIANTLGAVQIFPTQIDRCAINIQGARQAKISGLTIIGQNWVHNHTLIASIPFPQTISGWFDPALVKTGVNPGGLQVNSPYAGICIDAYANAAPAAPYPTVTYPAWTGLATQYNKSQSSNIEITDNVIQGFAVGINSVPNGDGNGDYVNVCRVEVSFNTFGLSIGNTQARNTKYCDITAQGLYASITNEQFGLQNGKIGGPLSNMSISQSYEMFDLATNLGTPLIVENAYGESLVRIGFFGSSSNVGTPTVIFNGGEFHSSIAQIGVIPKSLIESVGNPLFIFNGITLAGAARIIPLVDSANIQMNGGVFQEAQLVTVFNNAGIQRATNYTGSVFLGTASVFPNSALTMLEWIGPTNAVYMVDPTHINSFQSMGPFAYSIDNIHSQFTQSVSKFTDITINKTWDILAGPQVPALQLKSGSYTSVAPAYISCDIMTFTYIGAQQTAQNTNIITGDILYNVGSNNYGLFVVTNVGAVDGSGNYPITTRQMNAMTTDSGGNCTLNNIGDATIPGSTNLIHTGVLLPTKVYFGDFDINTTTISNVSQGITSTGTTLDTYVITGDKVWAYSTSDNALTWPYTVTTGSITLTTVTNGTPGKITLSTNPTQSGRFPILPLPVIGGSLPLPTTNTITLSALSKITANTMLGNWTVSSANVVANSMPSCTDTGGNHLNYISGIGITCGTSSGGGTGTVTSVSVVTANGVSGSVATATTTPAITLTLNAITPTSAAFSGCTIGTDVLCTTGNSTFNGNVTISAASFITTGSITSAAWTTTGIRTKLGAATYWDNSSSGTVANVRIDSLGTATFASTNVITVTNLYGSFFSTPACTGNPTCTNKFAIGAQSLQVIGASGVSMFGTIAGSDITGVTGPGNIQATSNLTVSSNLLLPGFGVTANGSSLYFVKTRGAAITTNTILNASDNVAEFRAFGADGATYRELGYITMTVDGAPGSNVMPGRIEFGTRGSASGATDTTRWIINKDGLLVGGATQAATVPAFQPSGTTMNVVLGDASAAASLSASNLTANGIILPNNSFVPTCGSGCASVTGNDQKLVVTTGTAQTSVTVNFGHTWSSVPVCAIGSGSTGSVVDIAATTITSITLGASLALTATPINLLCF